MQVEFINHNSCYFQDVINLGKKHSSTLGFMPEGGFIDHAQKKHIIIAHNGNELMGYLMFRTVNRSFKISIVHLCVDEAYRGQNITTNLLNALREEYEKIYSGISLSCRDDYKEASKVWERYGFVCKKRVRSRSIDEHYLKKWWYDFNVPDLFTSIPNFSTKIKALLDANIIIKLRDNKQDFDPSQDPRPLLADWLIDEVDYYYAPELFNEMTRDRDNERVLKTKLFLDNFTEAKFNVERSKSISIQLKTILNGDSENDISDRRQLASCIVSDSSYFITLDKEFLENREEIEETFDVQIFTPQEFILEIDQLINKEEYLPSKLLGVSFHSVSKVPNVELNNYIDEFLIKTKSEKKITFKAKVYDLASKINTSKIKVIKSKDTEIAFYGYEYNKQSIIVHFIRLLDVEYQQTIFMQLISDFIGKAINKELSEIKICEEYLSDNQNNILSKLGFHLEEKIWKKDVINKMIESSDLQQINKHFDIDYLNKGNTDETIYKEILINIERQYFPLKIKDLDIPCYIIPIKPYWASELFDYYISGETLFGAKPNKIWNIENVYYRSVKPIKEDSPARILWYVSYDSKSPRSKAIVASSYLDEVMTDKPKILFQKNKHYGIYEWKNIYELCKHNIDNDIRALRFSGTEVFKNHVPLDLIDKILISNGRKANTFASPVKINNIIYNQIYKIGSGKNK
ncbi:MAG: hypothetical protein H6Q16_376 [Bacteroidetes bacterium]|nr:hypothetical protein [Bacteroidota bacterium]